MRSDPLLDTDQAAEYCRMVKGSMHNYRSRKIGPNYLKLGSRVFYKKSELDRYLDSKEVECNAA